MNVEKIVSALGNIFSFQNMAVQKKCLSMNSVTRINGIEYMIAVQ
jgi:hypothetical protein